ncbi:MAG: hypothetical protein FWG98_10580 [Candidatus Cloacimonetes bacterium]|nr:hypothetical protein [Candidatus Cloacimonadota bacterium]
MTKTMIFILSLIIMICSLCSCIVTVDEDAVTKIQINNPSSDIFTHFRVNEKGVSNWIINQSGTFSKGSHTIELFPSLNTTTKYDIHLFRVSDNKTISVYDIFLSENGIVDFEVDEIIDIYILNETPVDFFYVYIRENNSQTWSFNRYGTFLRNEIVLISHIDPPFDRNKTYDIQLRQTQTGGIRATKYNYHFRQDGTIRFETSDLD